MRGDNASEMLGDCELEEGRLGDVSVGAAVEAVAQQVR
jgi:hypothetical protein